MGIKINLQLKLQTKIFLLASAFVLGISLVALFFMLFKSSDEIKKESFEKAAAITHRYSNVFEQTLGQIMSMTRAFAVTTNTIYKINTTDYRESIAAIVPDYALNLPEHSTVWVLFTADMPGPDGEGFSPHATVKGGSITYGDRGLWDSRHRELITRCEQAKIEIVSPVYRLKEGGPVLMTTFAVPLVHHGEVFAVVAIDYPLSSLSKILSSFTSLHEDSFAFLVSSDGLFVAHPWESYFGKNIADPKFKTPQQTIHNIQRGIEFDEIRHSPLTGLDWYIYFVPVIIGESQAPWSFGFSLPLSEVLKGANSVILIGLIIVSLYSLLMLVALFIISKNISTSVTRNFETLRKAIEQTGESVTVIGLNRIVELINPAKEKLTGKKATDLIGKKLDLESNRDGENPEEIWNSINQGEIWTGRLINKESGATIETTITPVRDENRNIVCFLEIGRDITHELMIEEELRQSQKMEAVGTLAGGIAHDFNNILTAIIGYGELMHLMLSNKNEDELGSLVDEQLQAAERAKELVKHILTFSRKTELELKPIIPKFLLKEILNFLRASLPSTIEINENIASGSAMLGDPTQFHQIVMNICTNASQAMSECGGTLRVELVDVTIGRNDLTFFPDLHEGDYLKLTISDTGAGISSEHLGRIFDPFFTTKAQGKGTGLGLSVVHGIVKNLHGSITVQSEPGEGSLFSVYFPVFDEAKKVFADDIGKSEIPCGKERIMVVDDEPSIVNIFRMHLEHKGYLVSCYNDSTCALDEFRKSPERWDLVITDYTMPKMTGLDLAEEMIKLRSEIPVVLISGYLEKEIEEEARAAGICAVMYKPVTVKEIGKVLGYRLRQSLNL